MFLNVDGVRFRIYNSVTSQGACHRCFLALMTDTPEALPPRGATFAALQLHGSHSYTSCNASEGGNYVHGVSQQKECPFTAKDLES
jgi:hypothetical protein